MNARTCIMLGMSALAPLAAVAQNWGTVSFEDENSFFNTYIKGRLHIGLSYADMSMDETSTPHEKAYLGNLDTIREEDTGAIGLSIKYDFCDYAAIMFANDMKAELSLWHNSGLSSDGSLKLDGYTIQAIGQYPWEIKEEKVSLIPYIGLGVTYMSASWSYANWWHWGWASPSDYEKYANGSTKPHNNYSRWMLPEDPSSAFTYTIGLVVQLYSHLDIDFFYRVVDLDDVETDFRVRSPHGPLMIHGAFPAQFSAYGVALKYVF